MTSQFTIPGLTDKQGAQLALVRGDADEVAERIAALGFSPQSIPGAIIRDRDWDDYSVGVSMCRRTWRPSTSSTTA